MADTKISALTGATTPLAGTEVVPVVQSATTKKVSVANLTAGRDVTANTLRAMGGASASGGGGVNGTLRLDRSDGVTNLGYVTWVTSGDEMRYYNNNGGFHSFYTNTFGKAFTICESYSNNVTVSLGNLVIGTSGKGIDFSAASHAAGMTSELLNDYEEGTWTVTWDSLTGTPTNTTGYYTKIGRVVTYSYETGSSTISGTAGSLGFYVPFTPSKQSTGTQVAGNLTGGGVNQIFTNAKVYCQTFAVTSNNMVFSGTFIV